MKRFIVSLLCALILLSVLSPAVFATDKPKVVDMEDLLTDGEEAELSVYLEEIGNQYDMDIVVITTDSLEDKMERDFVDDYWDENGYADNGVIFMLSLRERLWYISTAGSAQWMLSNRDIDDIADAALEYIGDENFYEGFMAFADECDNRLSLNNTYETYYEDEYSGYNDYVYEKPAFNVPKTLIIALIIGFFVGWIIAAGQKSKLTSVAMKTEASNYVKKDSLQLTNSKDLFLFSNVARTPIVRNNDSNMGGHSGSGSSVHMSSGGVSHGGHGGRF